MNQPKVDEVSGATKIAKWLFFIDFIYVFGAWIYTLNTSDVGEFIAFFYISCAVFIFCGIILGLNWLNSKSRKKEEKKEIHQILDCAIWWSCTGIAWWFGLVWSFITVLPGFGFCLFSLILWFKYFRLLYLSWRAR